MKTLHEKPFMTVTEVSKELNLSRARIHQLRNEGKLEGIQWGIWLFEESKVREFKKKYRFNNKSKKGE